jgi:hypothetical protein
MAHLLAIMALLTGLAQEAPEPSFIGRVVVEWMIDDDADRTMRLVEEFAFRDREGKVWRVPAGAEIDGASIPSSLYSIVGPPFVGDYRRASVVHDHYCRTRTESWRDVHRMFYDGIVAGGVPRVVAKVMYAAVVGWGPRWETRRTRSGDARTVTVPRPQPDASQLRDVEIWINGEDPSLEDIDRYVSRILGESSGASDR